MVTTFFKVCLESDKEYGNKLSMISILMNDAMLSGRSPEVSCKEKEKKNMQWGPVDNILSRAWESATP